MKLGKSALVGRSGAAIHDHKSAAKVLPIERGSIKLTKFYWSFD